MSAIVAYENAKKALNGAKPKLILYFDHLDAPAGIRKLYEKGFWEYQELKRLKCKLAGPAYREKMRSRNG